MFYNDFSEFYTKVKMILWSIRTFWYRGSAENQKNDKFQKRAISFKNSSPDLKADFSEKSLFGISRLILSRYDVILNI